MREQRARSVTDEWTYWVPDHGEEEHDARPVRVRQFDLKALDFKRGPIATNDPERVAVAVAEDRHSDWEYPEQTDVMVKHMPSGTAWHVRVAVELRPHFSGRCQGAALAEGGEGA